MFSNQGARKSVDSLSPVSTHSSRADFPFHRQGSQSSYSHNRRGSTASSIHSVGGVLDTSSGSWTNAVLESGQNAISTLLQPPIVRTGLLPHTSAPASSAHKPPTARDIPPVALTNIPHVDSTEFAPYLSQVGALYEQLRRVKENEDESADVPHRRTGRHDEIPDIPEEGHLRPGKRPSSVRKASVGSISSLSQLEAPAPVRRSSSSFNRRATQGPPPLSTIPTVYFDEDFHLENPRTFDVVSERSEVVRPAGASAEEKGLANGSAPAPRKALASNAILQEKLSWYMDTIEMHLISSISTASTTFFSALGSLRELHSEAAGSVDRIKALRQELQTLDEEIALSGLNIVQKRRRRENLQQLHDAVAQLREIVEGVDSCQSLVEAGEVDQALDGIESLEKLVAGEQMATGKGRPGIQLRDLRGAAALEGISSDMDTLRFRIGKVYESKLLSTLTGDLRRHVETVSNQEVLMRWSSAAMRGRGGHNREPSAFPSYMASTDELRSQLLSSLSGLQRAKHLTAAATAYREVALREIRALIRRPLPSSNDDDNESMMSSSTVGTGRQRTQQEKSTMLARNLRAMDPGDAEDLLVKIYIPVAETLRRLTIQVKVLLDVASLIGESELPSGLRSPPLKSPPFSPGGRRPSLAALEAQEEIHKALDLANLLGQAVDVAQDKIVKLLRVRAEQSTHLPLVWFLRYFTLNRHFANECEAISGRSGTNLKTVVNGHIKDFVQQHGDAEKQRLAQGMESDQWTATNFGDKESRLLDQVLEGSTRDPSAWLEGTKVWIPYSDVDSDNEANGVDEPHQPNGSGKPKVRNAVVDSESFVLPSSAILCLEGMTHFLHLITGIPPMTVDVSTSLIAYLQLFNSRCTQLILGAGATRSAGLRNITTRHLALASQALAFIATLITHVREFVRRQAGTGSGVSALMGEFDKVKRLYQEHQNSIYDKLVDIMSARVTTHARTMRTIDWDGDGIEAPHAYMDVLVRETTTLHRNLTKCLPEGTIRMIMAPVFKNYKETFSSALKEIEPRTEVGKESMLRDVESFNARLGKIDGFDEVGDSLLSIVKAKEIKAPAAPPPSPPPATAEVETEGKKGEKEPKEEVKDNLTARDSQDSKDSKDSKGGGDEQDGGTEDNGGVETTVPQS